MIPKINTIDIDERPFIAIWEVIESCDLAFVHCRANAPPDRNPMAAGHRVHYPEI